MQVSLLQNMPGNVGLIFLVLHFFDNLKKTNFMVTL